MPYVIMKSAKIPEGVLQLLDLRPNTSQRKPSAAYEAHPQSKYVRAVQRQTPILVNNAGTITFGGGEPTVGLEAWFLTNVSDGGGESLTVAEAVANVDAVLDLLKFGDDDSDAGALTLAAINGALPTGSITANQLPEVLSILAGRGYRVPADTQIETGLTFGVVPAVGTEGGPGFVEGSLRTLFNGSALKISARVGRLSKRIAARQVVVYTDDGNLY